MASSISTHVLDTAQGRPLPGVRVSLYRGTEVQVRIEDGHYHVPLLVSPFSCVTYRGS
jgi:5-hydroxyisourate hydrolase-like protein (transthyretin family)